MFSLNSLEGDESKFRFLVAVTRLKVDADFQLFIDALKKDLARLDKINRKSVGIDTQWQQGAAQYLSTLLESIESSRETAAKIKNLVEFQGTQ